jgi:ribosomal protein S27E
VLAKLEYMAKTRAKSLHYFETIRCEDCRGTEDLCQNRYSDAVKCTDCLNSLIDEEQRLIQEEQDRIQEEDDVREGYYTEKTYNELAEERNK